MNAETLGVLLSFGVPALVVLVAGLIVRAVHRARTRHRNLRNL